jgi:hypothetical protein
MTMAPPINPRAPSGRDHCGRPWNKIQAHGGLGGAAAECVADDVRYREPSLITMLERRC